MGNKQLFGQIKLGEMGRCGQPKNTHYPSKHTFVQLQKMPYKCWSREYFSKNEKIDKFECIFCGAKYYESPTKFKHHLLASLF